MTRLGREFGFFATVSLVGPALLAITLLLELTGRKIRHSLKNRHGVIDL